MASLSPLGESGLKFVNNPLSLEDLQGLTPLGESGVKFKDLGVESDAIESPSTRREWIEINRPLHESKRTSSPSTRRERIEMECERIGCTIFESLSPLGGSGLKSGYVQRHGTVYHMSPFACEERIEILSSCC